MESSASHLSQSLSTASLTLARPPLESSEPARGPAQRRTNCRRQQQIVSSRLTHAASSELEAHVHRLLPLSFTTIDLILDLPSYQQQRKGSAYTQATTSSSSWERHGQGARVRRRRRRSRSSSSSSRRIERASRRFSDAMMSEPSSRGGGLSMSAASSPSMAGTSVPSKRRSKASPSDVIFGQPPGSDEAVHNLGPLSTDSSPSSRPGSSRKRPHPRTSSPASAPPSTSPRAARGPPAREAETVAGAASRSVPGDVVDGVKVSEPRAQAVSTGCMLITAPLFLPPADPTLPSRRRLNRRHPRPSRGHAPPSHDTQRLSPPPSLLSHPLPLTRHPRNQHPILPPPNLQIHLPGQGLPPHPTSLHRPGLRTGKRVYDLQLDRTSLRLRCGRLCHEGTVRCV